MHDLVNSLFELSGGLFVLLNVRRIWLDRGLRGVSLVAIGFFWVWSVWNLFYYPSLAQWNSFWGGLGAFAATTVWLALALYYWRKDDGRLTKDD